MAPAGSLFALDADVVHTGGLADPEGYGYRVLYLDLAALAPLLREGASRTPVPRFREPVMWDRELRDLLDRTHRSVRRDTNPLRWQDLVLHTVRMLLKRHGRAPAEPALSTTGHRGVATAREYLEAHPADKVTLQQLSAVAGCSPYRLARMFRDQVGVPPHEYQTQLRVRMAQRLLTARMPVGAVATAVGFFDQAHFTKVFKKYTGVTPGRFPGDP